MQGATIYDDAEGSRPVDMGALEHSDAMAELMTALAKAQAEMDNPDKDTLNYYEKGYSSLAAVRNVVVPSLAKHGIAVTQHPVFSAGFVTCVTVLWHGAEWLKSTTKCPVIKVVNRQMVPVEDLSHQDYTGVFSYLRRVSLKAICGVADEGDEDGEASNRVPSQQRADSHRGAPDMGKPAKTPEQRVEEHRLDLLDEIAEQYKKTVVPLKHVGMHKALFAHCFHLDKPETIKAQSVEVLEAGRGDFAYLTGRLAAWNRTMRPEVWIAEQLALLVEPGAGIPAGVDATTGEDLSDMPEDWLTRKEQQMLEEQEAAAAIEQAANA